MSEVLIEVVNGMGRITLNRSKALNALSLDMIRAITAALLDWQNHPGVMAVVIRGSSREPGALDFGHFCAGGDIRFFHQAALAGDPRLEDFFTEEYRLNHMIHRYPKPYVALMDGVVMGGGMGISQGARLRVVTERSRLAMPETLIGLFPDVAGGYFLSRCPGHIGEFLALTGQQFGARDAIALGLADRFIESAQLAALWDRLASTAFASAGEVLELLTSLTADRVPAGSGTPVNRDRIDPVFSRDSVRDILAELECRDDSWSTSVAAMLRQRSPLMLQVTLSQIRRARSMTLADELRMERDMVFHCFHGRKAVASETVEGIRALAIDKDHAPRWSPARVEDVREDAVEAFFRSPWPAHAHPLRDLG